MSYALITGGSSGLGRAFANALADLGYNLILSSKSFPELAQAKKEIEEKYTNRVQIFVADLTDANARKNLFAYSKHYDVEIVINNAGIGYSESFFAGELSKEENLIKLNIEATHEIFKNYYQEFINKKSGRIINVSSLAAFIPSAYAATYGASKAFLANLSLAVREEAKKHNVIVQTLAPTSIKTNFYQTAGTKKKAYKGNPNKIARKAISSKMGLILPGFKAKATYFFVKIIPKPLVIKLSGKRQLRKKAD